MICRTDELYRRTQVSQLESRLSQSERPLSTESLQETLQAKLQAKLQAALQGLQSRCDEGDQKQKQALDGLETLRGRVGQLEQITRDLAEKQEINSTLPSPPSDQQQTAPVQEEKIPPTTSTPTSTTVMEDDIESLKSFVSESVAGMKDLVSGPLSVIFDAVRSDDFLGEDNFLTFSKAAVYQMFANSNQYQGLHLFLIINWRTG